MINKIQDNKFVQKMNNLFLSDEKVDSDDFLYFYGTYLIAGLSTFLICLFCIL